MLLISDGHGPHIASEFINHCKKNDIALYYFHRTHLLQLLDVGLFGR